MKYLAIDLAKMSQLEYIPIDKYFLSYIRQALDEVSLLSTDNKGKIKFQLKPNAKHDLFMEGKLHLHNAMNEYDTLKEAHEKLRTCRFNCHDYYEGLNYKILIEYDEKNLQITAIYDTNFVSDINFYRVSMTNLHICGIQYLKEINTRVLTSSVSGYFLNKIQAESTYLSGFSRLLRIPTELYKIEEIKKIEQLPEIEQSEHKSSTFCSIS